MLPSGSLWNCWEKFSWIGRILMSWHNTLLTKVHPSLSSLYYVDCLLGNLKMMMNLLRDKSRNIQFEAFHVFKVFVANPKKPPQIEAILKRNKEKLLAFLKGFHNDKEGACFLWFLHINTCLTYILFIDEQFSVCFPRSQFLWND